MTLVVAIDHKRRRCREDYLAVKVTPNGVENGRNGGSTCRWRTREGISYFFRLPT